jgi:hypothetical protein
MSARREEKTRKVQKNKTGERTVEDFLEVGCHATTAQQGNTELAITAQCCPRHIATAQRHV